MMMLDRMSDKELREELAILRARLTRLEETVDANAGLGVPGILRTLGPGESTVIRCGSDNHAASIRGSAYRILGKGKCVTRRISHSCVEVKRL